MNVLSIYTSNETPIILFFIPDGHSKETPITAQSKKETVTNAVPKAEEKFKKGQTNNEKKKGKTGDKVVAVSIWYLVGDFIILCIRKMGDSSTGLVGM